MQASTTMPTTSQIGCCGGDSKEHELLENYDEDDDNMMQLHCTGLDKTFAIY